MHDLVTPATFISAFAFGFIAAYLAYKRKRNPYLWFFIGFFFGVFGLLGIFFSPLKRKIKLTTATQKEKPIPVLPGPFNKFWYYLDPTHQQVGPMSHGAITKALYQGEISESTFVWNEDMSEWKKIVDLSSQS